MNRAPTEATLRAAYESAKDRYSAWGVDPEAAAGVLKSLSLIPGKHRVNLHPMYLESDSVVDRRGGGAVPPQAPGLPNSLGRRRCPGYKITSEAPSHLRLHLDALRRGSAHRCVVHTHPLSLIALSHHPVLGKDEALFTRSIWQMLPEVRAFVPRGVGIVPYTMPGSADLGEKTITALAKRDVALWSMHGATSMGRDALEAFDFIDVADKGARLLLDCWAAGYKPVGNSRSQMDALATEFRLAADDFGK